MWDCNITWTAGKAVLQGSVSMQGFGNAAALYIVQRQHVRHPLPAVSLLPEPLHQDLQVSTTHMMSCRATMFLHLQRNSKHA